MISNTREQENYKFKKLTSKMGYELNRLKTRLATKNIQLIHWEHSKKHLTWYMMVRYKNTFSIYRLSNHAPAGNYMYGNDCLVDLNPIVDNDQDISGYLENKIVNHIRIMGRFRVTMTLNMYTAIRCLSDINKSGFNLLSSPIQRKFYLWKHSSTEVHEVPFMKYLLYLRSWDLVFTLKDKRSPIQYNDVNVFFVSANAQSLLVEFAKDYQSVLINGLETGYSSDINNYYPFEIYSMIKPTFKTESDLIYSNKSNSFDQLIEVKGQEYALVYDVSAHNFVRFPVDKLPDGALGNSETVNIMPIQYLTETGLERKNWYILYENPEVASQSLPHSKIFTFANQDLRDYAVITEGNLDKEMVL